MDKPSSSTRRGVLIGLGILGAGAAIYAVFGRINQGRVSGAQRRLQEERKRMVQSIKHLETEGMINRVGLAAFMKYWNDAVVERLKSAPFPPDRVQAEILKTGSIFMPPATHADFSKLEGRLALRLPPSLAAFFGHSNGVKAINDYADEPLDFFPCGKVSWLIELDRQLVDIWTKEPVDVPDAEYFRYGPDQDEMKIRSDYLKRIVALGPVVDGGVCLLNPNVSFPDGEMEAWDFSSKYPGARRYRSFNGLLEAHCRDSCWNLEYWSVSYGWT